VPARRHRDTRLRRGVVVADRHGACARGAAMLHPRDDFLADIATFAEIDAAELIHIGFVRKGVAVAEINAAMRHAKRNAMSLVFARIDRSRAEIGGGVGSKLRRNDRPHAKRRQARIGIA
jgi:hypothetical protein